MLLNLFFFFSIALRYSELNKTYYFVLQCLKSLEQYIADVFNDGIYLCLDEIRRAGQDNEAWEKVSCGWLFVSAGEVPKRQKKKNRYN